MYVRQNLRSVGARCSSDRRMTHSSGWFNTERPASSRRLGTATADLLSHSRSPPPQSPPRPTEAGEGTAGDDPIFVGSDGLPYEVRGEPGAVFNLFSAKELSINAVFEAVDPAFRALDITDTVRTYTPISPQTHIHVPGEQRHGERHGLGHHPAGTWLGQRGDV